jgi:hypothetical protein
MIPRRQESLTREVLKRGARLRVWPVHARREFRDATIQSSRPSRCTTTRDVMGDFVAIRAVKGVVEDIF